MDGNPIMHKNSEFSTSAGDEAGTAGGGIITNKQKGPAKFIMYSFDVKVIAKDEEEKGEIVKAEWVIKK